MTSGNPTTKLSGEALESARRFNEALKRYHSEMQALSDEMVLRHREVAKLMNAEGKKAWGLVAEACGIDPEESWASGAWFLDTTYLDEHGDAYLCKRTSESQVPGNLPLAAAPTSGRMH